MITLVDVELFKSEGTIHMEEHRKVTSSNNYFHFESAHPLHTFPGIIKSQLYRIQTVFEKCRF